MPTITKQGMPLKADLPVSEELGIGVVEGHRVSVIAVYVPETTRDVADGTQTVIMSLRA